MDETSPQRILIVGSAGAGKSTFARDLGRVSGLPVVHLDALYWRPGWIEPSREEWSQQLVGVLGEARWILDGNYGATMKQRARAADAAVIIERSRYLCLWRIVRRYVRYRGRSRIDRAEGCAERIDWPFVVYVWRYPRVSRAKVERRLAEAGCESVVILRSQRDLDRYLGAWPPR